MIDELRHSIAEIVERHNDDESFSGVCLVMRGEDEVFHRAFGLAHRGFNVPNSTATRFDIASITKTFTAVATVQLIDRGDIALDTPVMPFLGLTGTAISDQVTVFHLLTHTSGIADDADEEAGEDYELLFVDKPNYSIRETVDFIPQFAYKAPNFAPGEGVRYNNCAFVLLGLAIEKATGVSFRDYVRQHVFQPAGMTDSDFLAMDAISPNLAEHYKATKGPDGEIVWVKNIYSYPPIGSPDGGATTTARDLATFLSAVRHGELTSQAGRDLLWHPHVDVLSNGRIRTRNGFAFEFRLDDSGEILTIQKDGQNAGVASQMSYYPQTDTTVVILANMDCDVWALHTNLRDLLAQPAGNESA